MEKIEFNEVCKSCKGTGLYCGIGEREKAAVVCYQCEGTGCFHFKHEYEPFKERKKTENIERVIQCNPGIMINEKKEFGGMSFEDWENGKEFIPGMEMRKYTCPAWWYQTADYKLKPEWNECAWSGSFSACKHFSSKHLCWEKWDKENEKKP